MSEQTAAEKKKAKKAWQPPAPRTVQIEVPGQAPITATIRSQMGTIETKVRAFGRFVRNADGSLAKLPYAVKEVSISITLPSGTISARSCCKPPDAFHELIGIYFAARRLVKNPNLPKEYSAPIMRTLVPQLFETRSSRRRKANATDNATPTA